MHIIETGGRKKKKKVRLHYINLAGRYLKKINKHMPYLGLYKYLYCTHENLTHELFSYSKVLLIQCTLCRPYTIVYNVYMCFAVLLKLKNRIGTCNVDSFSHETCSKSRFKYENEASLIPDSVKHCKTTLDKSNTLEHNIPAAKSIQ